MAQFTFRLVRHCGAPPEQVYRVLADVPAWPTWMPAVSAAAFERMGDVDPRGAGAIRRLTALGVTVAREQVLEARPPHYQRYAVISSAPVRNYAGAVHIEAEGEGSRITWESEFRPLVPGTGAVMRLLIARTVAVVASSLVKAAEKSSAADAGRQSS